MNNVTSLLGSKVPAVTLGTCSGSEWQVGEPVGEPSIAAVWFDGPKKSMGISRADTRFEMQDKVQEVFQWDWYEAPA